MQVKTKQQLIPNLKKVEPDFGSSIKYARVTNGHPDTKYWHYHPEIEIVYIKNGFGKRYVGSSISKFEDGDLILMGPNIPHFGYNFGLQDLNEEIVVQFKKELIETPVAFMPELKPIGDLIEKAKAGISFYGETLAIVGKELEQMQKKEPFDRLQSMFNILHVLAKSEEYELLNANGMTLIIQNPDDSRISQVYQYVKDNYDSDISLEEISQIAHMTVPSFCRHFKKYTQKTFTQFVNEFRIGKAIQLFSTSNKTITEISNEVGFNNFSHFSKQFKRVTGEAPSKYKKSMIQILS